MQRKLSHDLIAICLLACAAYLAAALWSYDPADPVRGLVPPLDQLYLHDIVVYPERDRPSNWCGSWGATIADLLVATTGAGAVLILAAICGLGVGLLRNQGLPGFWVRAAGWVLTLAGSTALVDQLADSLSIGPIVGPGGYLGALTGGLLQANFGWFGAILLGVATTVVGMMFWTDYLLFRAVRIILAPLQIAARSAGRPERRVLAAAGTGPRDSDIDGTLEQRPGTPRFRAGSLRDDLSRRQAEPLSEIGPSAEVAADESESDFDVNDDTDAESSAAVRPTIPIRSRVAARQTPAVAAAPPAPSAAADSPGHSPAKSSGKSKTSDPRAEVIHQLNQAAQADKPANHFDLPNIELLECSSAVSVEELRDEALRKAAILEKTFRQFGFNIRVVDIETGPVIAQYELELEAGLRLAKITNLADDLAIALRVPSVRIVAPIPGKNTVGIEVPNESRQTVRLRDVMEQSAGKAAKMKIPLFLGDDVRGEPLIVDLASLPHLLIAGRTGTGKSVCLNAIITSMLMTRRPDEVRMLMIDPKMVELSGYGKLPHLMHPVVTDMRKAEAILAWAVDKMEERYSLLAKAGVRHITSYNQLGEQELLKRLQPETPDEVAAIPLSLPFIVIVADEMADLMMTAGKEVQQHIIRLAQKSRAVGIHLILATQKPTVDVITGLIKSNLPARICFQVATRTDSQVVLDSNGAEKLLGNGDMLFLWPGTSTLLRGQGTFLTDDEINAVTAAVSTGEQNFVHELVHLKVSENAEQADESSEGDFQDRDELYENAVELVIREGRGSVSLLQRALGIGYGRAGRLIDFMEQDGVVGVYAGQKSREVIMTMAQWEEKKAGGGGGGGGGGQPAIASSKPIAVAAVDSTRKSALRDDWEEDDDRDSWATADDQDEDIAEEDDLDDDLEDEDESEPPPARRRQTGNLRTPFRVMGKRAADLDLDEDEGESDDEDEDADEGLEEDDAESLPWDED